MVIKSSEEFLLNFVCVDAASLPAGTRSFTFGLPPSHRHSPDPGYKNSGHGKGPKDFDPLPEADWERGNQLVRKLKNGQIGRVVRMAGGGQDSPEQMHQGSTARVEEDLAESDVKSIGSIVRLPITGEQQGQAAAR